MITTKAELGVYVISFVASLTGEFNHSQRLVVGCETIVCQLFEVAAFKTTYLQRHLNKVLTRCRKWQEISYSPVLSTYIGVRLSATKVEERYQKAGTVENVDIILLKKKFCDFSMFYVLDNFQQFSKIMEMSPHPILRSKCFLVFRYFGQFAALKNNHGTQPYLQKYELEMSV